MLDIVVSTIKFDHYIKENFLDLITLFPFITGEVYSLVEAIHDVCRGSVGVLQLARTTLSVCSGLR